MEIVNNVATWAGLLLGIASIVLAVVTIIFARATDDRSDKLSQQTITSLQKIETTVERLSQDTNGLIKAAWDKMLDPRSADGGPSAADAASLNDLSEALAEIRAEVQNVKQSASKSEDGQAIEALQKSVTDLQEKFSRPSASVSRALREQRERETESVGQLTKALESISSMAVELARALLEGGRHLTRDQFESLLDSPIGAGLLELRTADILVPMRPAGRNDDPEAVVFWFPPRAARPLETALALVGRKSEPSARRVRRYLQNVGYNADPSPEPRRVSTDTRI